MSPSSVVGGPRDRNPWPAWKKVVALFAAIVVTMFAVTACAGILLSSRDDSPVVVASPTPVKAPAEPVDVTAERRRLNVVKDNLEQREVELDARERELDEREADLPLLDESS